MKNTVPKPKDILKMVDWHIGYDDLYPGYSMKSVGSDYYFESKWQADDWAQMVYNIFTGFPKIIPVYRTVLLYGDISNLNREFLGEHWSWDKNAALAFGNRAYNDYLLSGEVKHSSVDWWSSVQQFIDFSQQWSDEDELELVIPSGQVANLKVRKIR